MTVNPTLRARSIRPIAAASSSAFVLTRVVSPSEETSQSLKTTFTSRYPVPRSRSSTCSAPPQLELIYRQGTHVREREPHLMLVTRPRRSRGKLVGRIATPSRTSGHGPNRRSRCRRQSHREPGRHRVGQGAHPPATLRGAEWQLSRTFLEPRKGFEPLTYALRVGPRRCCPVSWGDVVPAQMRCALHKVLARAASCCAVSRQNSRQGGGNCVPDQESQIRARGRGRARRSIVERRGGASRSASCLTSSWLSR